MNGFDLARSCAVFGMVLVNFKIVMGAHHAPDSVLKRLSGLLDGRASATFVVLAGIGMSLLTASARATKDTPTLMQKRKILWKRALFLFVAGLLYTPLWPADILHFYGIYIALGTLLINAATKRLWLAVLGFVLGFVVLLLLGDYSAEWNWETFAYHGFWTASGMIKHLFFNGFHPVFPWVAFLLAGIALGRLDWHQPRAQRRILFFSATAAVLFELLSKWLVNLFSHNTSGLDPQNVPYLFGTNPMPPMPLYILAAGSTAIAFISLCAIITEHFPKAVWTMPLVSTGRLALSLYVAHVLIGMGALEVLGLLNRSSLPLSVTCALVFCGLSVLFAHLWCSRFSRGPLEWGMRIFTG